MWQASSLEKILMLGKIEGRRRKVCQRMRWLDGLIDSMDMSLSRLREMVLFLVAQSYTTLCDPIDCSLPGSSPWGVPGKNTGVGYYFLLQGIFLTQGLNRYLLYFLHWQWFYTTVPHIHIRMHVYIYIVSSFKEDNSTALHFF